MADCRPAEFRHQITIAGVEADSQTMEAAQRYADHYGVSLSDLIECALVTYMHQGNEPVVLKWCMEHRCVMEVNSSGTTEACPWEESGPDNPVFKPELVFPRT